MNKNNILNIETLISHNNKNRINTSFDYKSLFTEILHKCHAQITRYSKKHNTTECLFKVPVHIFGKPVYNHSDLITFLLMSLHNNGLFAEYIYTDNNILISWNKSHIDYNKYVSTRDSGKMPETSSFIPQNNDKYKQAQRVQQERDTFFKSLCTPTK